jgi:hypothetical protein
MKKCLAVGIILLFCSVTTAPSIKFNEINTININTNYNGWDIEIIDTVGDVGKFSSLALDSHDNPHIIYIDETHFPYKLKYAYKIGSTWVCEIIDNYNFTGLTNTGRSIAIDSQDNIHIVYLCYHFDPWWCQVKYAVRTNNTWESEILDNTTQNETPVLYPSLALDKYDKPHIAYIYNTTGNYGGVKYLTYNGSDWVYETVVLPSTTHDSTATLIAVDTFCRPHITFLDGAGVYYASKEEGVWNVSLIDYGFYPNIAVDSSGVPHISYDKETSQGLNLIYAKKNNGYWENNTVDTNVRLQLNIAIDSNDHPHIAYSAKPYEGLLKYAWFTGSEWELMEVDEGLYESTGTYSSIVIDSNGMPHISYYDSNYDETSGDLRYASLISYPPTKPEITGQTSGKVGKEYEYSIVSEEPDGDSIYYFVDWGDNSTIGWLGQYSSGEEIVLNHTWSAKGTYNIKAKAKDVYGAESDWGILQVTMPFSYEPPHLHFIEWLLEHFPNAFPILRFLLEFNH